ncbi:MAG: TlpA disulfide reductase family protein, partial [bacterium]
YSFDVKKPGKYLIYLNDKSIYPHQRDLIELQYPEADLCLLKTTGYTIKQADEVLACFLIEDSSDEKVKLVSEKAALKDQLESVGVRLWRFNLVRPGRYTLKTEVFFNNSGNALSNKWSGQSGRYFSAGLFLLFEDDYNSAINGIIVKSLIPFFIFFLVALAVPIRVLSGKLDITPDVRVGAAGAGLFPGILKVFSPFGRNSRQQFIAAGCWIATIQFQIFIYLISTSQQFYSGGQVFQYFRKFFNPQTYYLFQIATGGLLVSLFQKIGSISDKLLIVTIILLAILNCFNFMKRIRDINWYAFWLPVLTVLFPLFSFSLLYIFGNSMAYRNTSPFKDYFYLAPVFLYGGYVLIVIFLLLTLFLMLKKGTDGPNRFGADPLKPEIPPAEKSEVDLSEKQKQESRFRKMLFFSGAAFWFVLMVIILFVYSNRPGEQKRVEEKAPVKAEEYRQTTKPPALGMAPDIIVEDFNGNKVKLSDFRGKVVMLNFWATWCPPCRNEMPSIEMLLNKMKGKDFVIMAVSMGEEKDKVKKFIEDNDYTFPIYLDKDRSASSKYSVTGIPTTLLIDNNGSISYKKVGSEDWVSTENLSRIERLLGAESKVIKAENTKVVQKGDGEKETAMLQDFESIYEKIEKNYGTVDVGQVESEGENNFFRFLYTEENSGQIKGKTPPHSGYAIPIDLTEVDKSSVLVFKYRSHNVRDLRLTLALDNQNLLWVLDLPDSEKWPAEWKEIRLPLEEKYAKSIEDVRTDSLQIATFAGEAKCPCKKAYFDLDEVRIESAERLKLEE